MAVNSLNQLSSRAIIGRYYKELEAITGMSWVDRVSTQFGSNQDKESYKWLGMSPALRQWVGGRQAKGLSAKGVTIENVHFEATLDIHMEDIRRDKTDQIMVRVNDLAKRYNEHWAKLLSTAIEAGTSTDCYDGQYFFDDDHSEGASGTQKNLLTATEVTALDVTTATAPTEAEMSAALLGVVSYMMAYKDDQGEPMNADARSWMVMCPATPIWSAAVGAVKNQVINQSTNTLQTAPFSVEVVCNPRLTGTAVFYVVRTDANVKGLIRQQETEGALQAIAEGSELEFNEGVWRFGLDTWRNVGYGYWQMAAHCTLS